MRAKLTRQQLHDLIWSAPMRDIAKQLGLSDVGLRKRCMRSFVPPPPQGYWNKVKAGQSPKRLPLPPRPPGVPDEIYELHESYNDQAKRVMVEELVPPVFPEPIESIRERVRKNIGLVKASRDLTTPHIAFRRQVEDDQRKKLAGSTWDRPQLDTPFEQRRLKILQGLFYGLSRVDCTASVEGKDVRKIYIEVGHQRVQITLDKIESRNHRQQKAEGHPALKLTLLKQSYSETERTAWRDSESARLEDQLSEIAAEIVVAGELQYREHLEWRYSSDIQRRKQLQEEAVKRKIAEEKAEVERLRKLEEDRLRRLLDDAGNHRLANDIRLFVATIGALPAAGATPEDAARWRDWALAQADRIDPVVTGAIWQAINDLVGSPNGSVPFAKNESEPDLDDE